MTPIEPDPETAREWAQEELSKEVYADGGSSWLRDFFDWLSGLGSRTGSFGDVGIPGIDVGGIVAVALILVLLGVVAYVFLGPVRAARRARKSVSVFEDDDRDSAAIRNAAAEAAARGEWTAAALERFRAVVRRLEDSGRVIVVPGMTAFEFVVDAAVVLPTLVSELEWAGELFDALRYGHATGAQGDYLRMTALDTAVERPSKVGVAA